jgi:hypothetical protein
MSGSFLVTAGTPLEFSVELIAFVDPHDSTATGTYDYSGTANFGSTATLLKILAFSDAGLTNPIGFFLTSQSGTEYTHDTPGADVPEPSAALLLAGVGVALAIGRRSLTRTS